MTKSKSHVPELNDTSNFDLIFVTAAQTPSITGLQASQVLAPAIHMADSGYRVTWIAAISLLTYLNDVLLRKGKIDSVKNKCADNGIRFIYTVVPLPINSILSFLVHRPIFKLAAKAILKTLDLDPDRKTILHARSYYAAGFANAIKAKSGGKCYVSFDMRSVLPEEYALTQGLLGKLSFAYLKQWEFDLLSKSDIAFLPLNFARERIFHETSHRVVFAPIQGFDRSDIWTIDFESRWSDKYIGYAGSIGAWHDPEILIKIFNSIPGTHPVLAMEPHPALTGIKCDTYSQPEMELFYDKLLALVIPGRNDLNDYFAIFQMRCNLFSTKAAEALSRGVPLIVSSELNELAEFVRHSGCGAIFNPTIGKFVFPESDWLESKSEWLRLTKNAAQVGEKYTRDYAMKIYKENWSLLVNKAP